MIKSSEDFHNDAVSKAAKAIEPSSLTSVHFLNAWKEAVRLAGPDLFNVTSNGVGLALDKDQLRPSLSVISASLGTLSDGERRFVIALYQFYCASDIAAVCREQDIDPVSLSDIAMLDDERRSIIIRLLNSYTGW